MGEIFAGIGAVVIIVLLIAGVNWALRHERKELFNVLKLGAKNEGKTLYGKISLGTVISIGVMGFLFLSISKALAFLEKWLHLEVTELFPYILLTFSLLLLTLILNFFFLGFIARNENL